MYRNIYYKVIKSIKIYTCSIVLPYSWLIEHPTVPSMLVDGINSIFPSFRTTATILNISIISSFEKPRVSKAIYLEYKN